MDREHVRRPEHAAQPAKAARVARKPASRARSVAGNAALARLVDGEGILEGGVVHPDVERAIAARAGRGRRLDAAMGAWARESLGLDPDRIGIHHDPGADALSRAVSARAFAVRSDVFFAAGEYRPDSPAGRRLISHELAHVSQQQGSAAGGPLRVSEPGDAHERHAEEVSRELDG
jgi:hypothetical protein